MTEEALNYPVLIGLTGGIVGLCMLVKSALARTPVPPLVGFLVLGIAMRLADARIGLLTLQRMEVLGFLSKIGLVALLFRVGLESDLGGLLRQLRRASFVWGADVAVSGLAGFLTAYYVLDLEATVSAIVAAAFTATSVGISVAVWKENGALQSPNGELLIDVAELDDISAVVLMAALFALMPTLRGAAVNGLVPVIAEVVGVLLVKLMLFTGFCFLFSRYLEPRMTAALRRLPGPPEPMLGMVAVAFLIAALAAVLDFSVAIGAFFAGLVFSRDPQAVKMDAGFTPLYDLFSPFFFVGIGLDISVESMLPAAGMGMVLLVAAAAGKVLADGLPVWGMAGWSSGLLIGTSMVPRAEIAMAIMQRGQRLGEVPPAVYGAMIVVSVMTCILGPVAVKGLLKRWPQAEGSS